jgi:hypothetical protein
MRPTQNQKHVILHALLFVVQKTPTVSIVHSPKLVITADDKHVIGVSFTLGETIHFWSLEFIIDRFSSLGHSAEGHDSGAVFVGVSHSRSPLLHTILEDSTGEGDTTSSGEGSFGLPISRECSVVTPNVPITTTPPSEGTPMPLTNATISQPDTGLSPEQQQAYQEEQHARAYTH